MLNNEKIPPQMVYDMVRKLRKQGKTNKEISEKLKITLLVIEGTL